LPPLHRVCGIVISGSAAFVTVEEAWNFVAAEYILQAHSRKIPILGVCYGHQLLAWTFKGRVDFHPSGREIGTTEIRLTAPGQNDRLLGNLPNPFLVQVSHLQSVSTLPDKAELLAENDFESIHAFRLGACTWGVQFHPEFDAQIMQAYLLERKEILQAEGLEPDALLRSVAPSPESGGLLKRFARIARGEI
jgi:GMP synthase (glutamine-hydrolysing)|tara:strand:- start:330 stop:905 length:576 start_codon:yes stop_codon:yes gene_type:complete